MVTFNAKLPDSYLQQVGLYNQYRLYPGMNEGIKYTTNTSGVPLKTNEQGVYYRYGLVRPMTGSLTAYDTGNQVNLPWQLDNTSQLVQNGKAWGDTDTSAGLNYATDQLLAQPSSIAKKVIVLVSDGRPHSVVGGYNSPFTQAAINAADRAGREGIRIHTVTLEGAHGANFVFNEGLVRNGGAALRAANADDLRDLLLGIGAIEIGHPRLLK